MPGDEDVEGVRGGGVFQMGLAITLIYLFLSRKSVLPPQTIPCVALL